MRISSRPPSAPQTAAPAPQRPAAPPPSQTGGPAPTDSFAQPQRTPVMLAPPPPPPPPPQLQAERPASNPVTPRPRPTPDSDASTLRTERLNDGRSNCLEEAYELAQPGDQVVLLADSTDPVGHAVVQRPDGTVVDPNEPANEYADLNAWQEAHPDYRDPQAVAQEDLQRLFSAAPGPERDTLIQELGLQRVASRQVADELVPAGVSEARAAEIDRLADDVTDGWDLMDTLEGIPEGPERDYFMRCLMEREAPELGLVSTALGEFGNPSSDFSAEEAALVGDAMASAYESGMITDAHLDALLDPQNGLAWPGGQLRDPLPLGKFLSQVPSDALRTHAATTLQSHATRLEAQGNRNGSAQLSFAAAQTASQSPAAAQALLAQVGPENMDFFVGRLFNGESFGVLTTERNSVVGGLFGAASPPRTATTDAMAASILSHGAISENLRDSTLRGAVADYLALVRNPTDAAARSADAAQWNEFLASDGGRQMLGNASRDGTTMDVVRFLMTQPAPSTDLANRYDGDFARYAAHFGQEAIGDVDPSEISPQAEIPAEMMAEFPELAGLPPPVTAASVGTLVPDPLSAETVATRLEHLASVVEDTGNPDLGQYGASPFLSGLITTLWGNPIENARVPEFADMSAGQLRDLAAQIRTETDPQVIANGLVLGALQHRAYFDNVQAFAHHIEGQGENIQGQIGLVRGASEMVLTASANAVGMALGGPAGAAAANGLVGSFLNGRDQFVRNGGSFDNFNWGENLLVGIVNAGASAASGILPGALNSYLTGSFKNLSPAAQMLISGGTTLAGATLDSGLSQLASLIGDPKKREELANADPEVRQEILNTFVVGVAAGLIPWEDVTGPGEDLGPVWDMFGESVASLPTPENPLAEELAKGTFQFVGNAIANAQMEAAAATADSPEELLDMAIAMNTDIFAGASGAQFDETTAAALLWALYHP